MCWPKHSQRILLIPQWLIDLMLNTQRICDSNRDENFCTAISRSQKHDRLEGIHRSSKCAMLSSNSQWSRETHLNEQAHVWYSFPSEAVTVLPWVTSPKSNTVTIGRAHNKRPQHPLRRARRRLPPTEWPFQNTDPDALLTRLHFMDTLCTGRNTKNFLKREIAAVTSCFSPTIILFRACNDHLRKPHN